MGCSQNLICRLRHHHFAVSFLIIVIISTSSHLRLFSAEGRKLAQNANNSKEEKGIMLRVQMGSRPPHCERRCSSCANCEAIQVPTNPPIKKSTTTYARGDDDSSNYKPMSWKCKCGSFIFNP